MDLYLVKYLKALGCLEVERDLSFKLQQYLSHQGLGNIFSVKKYGRLNIFPGTCYWFLYRLIYTKWWTLSQEIPEFIPELLEWDSKEINESYVGALLLLPPFIFYHRAFQSSFSHNLRAEHRMLRSHIVSFGCETQSISRQVLFLGEAFKKRGASVHFVNIMNVSVLFSISRII